MIGDLILWVKKFIKQNFICIHTYKKYGNTVYNPYSWLECTKCGKEKKL